MTTYFKWPIIVTISGLSGVAQNGSDILAG